MAFLLFPTLTDSAAIPITEPQDNEVYCSCIKTARLFGVVIPFGTDAEDIVSSSTPEVGGLALFSYENTDHVAVITSISETGFTVVEGNYKRCQKTNRFIEWNDPRIRGFAL